MKNKILRFRSGAVTLASAPVALAAEPTEVEEFRPRSTHGLRRRGTRQKVTGIAAYISFGTRDRRPKPLLGKLVATPTQVPSIKTHSTRWGARRNP